MLKTSHRDNKKHNPMTNTPVKNTPSVSLISDFLFLVCLLAVMSLGVLLITPAAKATDLPAEDKHMSVSLQNLSQQIDARIANMKLIAKTVANDTHIHDWVDNGFAKEQESLLVDKLGFLVSEYGLTSASFADKTTNKYWNHEGFLRVLQPEIDTWYFAYLASKEQDLISVYHDLNNNRVDIYVNYQQIGANGLSGIATSFDGVLAMMVNSEFAKNGEIYLVDSSGQIQVHANAEVAGNKKLQDIYSKAAVTALFKESLSETYLTKTETNTVLAASYIPSMNWYLVVALD
jgi:methyl-accepting chemotaxis protein